MIFELKPLQEFVSQVAKATQTRPYLPTSYVPVLAAGASTSFEIRGEGGEAFAITRMLFDAHENVYSGPSKVGNGADASNNVLVSATVNPGGEEYTLFRDVHMNALKEFFSYNQFDIPVLVEGSNVIEFTVTNTGANEVEVFAVMQGWNHRIVSAIRETWTLNGKGGNGGNVLPIPQVFYMNTSLSASQQDKPVDLKRRAKPFFFHRLMIGGSDLRQINVQIERNNDLVLPYMPASVVNEAYKFFDEVSHFPLNAAEILTFRFSNAENSPNTVSVIGLGYNLKT